MTRRLVAASVATVLAIALGTDALIALIALGALML
jgi:hypothetical protein